MSDSVQELSNGYIFVGEGAGNEFIVRSGDNYENFVIPCSVVSYNYNEDFIIAAQRPNNDCFLEEDERKLNFWIISHKQENTIGPLTIDQFLKKRKELNIDENLVLKIEI